MNPNELDFMTDVTGCSYKLREAGVKACQSINDEEQHAAVKQTLKILFKYADTCFEDRKAEKAVVVARITKMHADAAKFQHALPTESTEAKVEVQDDKPKE
jgi:hypothetical protein